MWPKLLTNWRFGLFAVITHHCGLLLLEWHYRFVANPLDYLDAIPYQLLNSVAAAWNLDNYGPLFDLGSEWFTRGWKFWCLFLILTSIQWFLIGSAIGKAKSLLDRKVLRLMWRREPILKLAGVVWLLYVIWYAWVFGYSYRWFFSHWPMRYEYCGILNTMTPSLEAAENSNRMRFLLAYQKGSAARLATIGYPEEHGPYTSWFFLEDAKQPVEEMYILRDHLHSFRFRDFTLKGWTVGLKSKFIRMSILSYVNVKECYDRTRKLRVSEPREDCAVFASSFYDSRTDQQYLAIYTEQGSVRLVAIY